MSRRGQGSGRTSRRLPGTGPAFTPLNLGAALNVWLRADKGITLNGSNVATWADQSGNGHNVTQGTAAKQPGFLASGGPNNTPFVRGVKANATSLNAAWTWPQPQEIFVIARWGAVANGDTLMDGSGGNVARIMWVSAGTLQFLGDGAINVLQAAGITETSWNRYDVRWAGTSGAASVGTTAATQFSGTGDGVGPAGGLFLFSFGDGTSAPSNTDIAEVIGTNGVLNAGQRAQVVAYLQARYGVA